MNLTLTWYQHLIKPFWAPPSAVFTPVWTVLYIIIVFSFFAVFYAVWKKQVQKEFALPFVLNLLFNLLYAPIQFQLQDNYLAAVDILLILGTLVWFILEAYHDKRLRWVAFANVPYLAWVSFATVLQLTITYLNR